MYASVLEKFVEVGVDMMPTLDSITESQETLKVRAACSPKAQLVSYHHLHCSTWVSWGSWVIIMSCCPHMVSMAGGKAIVCALLAAVRAACILRI